MALTDHDTVAGWGEFSSVARDVGIEPVPAVEISSDYRPGLLHILGYYIDPESPILLEHLQWLQGAREARNDTLFARLNQLGLRLRWQDVETFAGGTTMGRRHFAQAMVARGYVTSIKEAFSLYLGPSRPAYVARRSLDPLACIQLIHEAGGLAFFAHPFTVSDARASFVDVLNYLVQGGLDGLEVYYPEHSNRDVRSYIRAARRKKLLLSGGSDFHGSPEEGRELGFAGPDRPVPDSVLEDMKKALG